MGTSISVDDLAARQKQLTDLLIRNPPTPVADILKEMKISRAWYYELRKRLVDLGILYPQELREDLPADLYSTWLAHPQATMSAPYHAPVRHVRWSDADGTTWAVQGALLDRWDGKNWPDALPDERVVVVRRASADTTGQMWAFVASRRQRWTTADTRRYSLPGQLSLPQLQRLTRVVAWVLEVDAVIPPETRTDAQVFIEDGPHDPQS